MDPSTRVLTPTLEDASDAAEADAINLAVANDS